mmetsp:Transcript_74884/g.243264  ORF Transcript_74884/g.243264 Transcript_74884/m.243264 type:complete len:355 (-) Transcript_74884:1759-2823(-)
MAASRVCAAETCRCSAPMDCRESASRAARSRWRASTWLCASRSNVEKSEACRCNCSFSSASRSHSSRAAAPSPMDAASAAAAVAASRPPSSRATEALCSESTTHCCSHSSWSSLRAIASHNSPACARSKRSLSSLPSPAKDLSAATRSRCVRSSPTASREACSSQRASADASARPTRATMSSAPVAASAALVSAAAFRASSAPSAARSHASTSADSASSCPAVASAASAFSASRAAVSRSSRKALSKPHSACRSSQRVFSAEISSSTSLRSKVASRSVHCTLQSCNSSAIASASAACSLSAKEAWRNKSPSYSSAMWSISDSCFSDCSSVSVAAPAMAFAVAISNSPTREARAS